MSKEKKIAIILSFVTILLFLICSLTQKYLHENKYYTYLVKDKLTEEVQENIRKEAYALMKHIVDSDYNSYVFETYKPLKVTNTNLRYVLRDSTGKVIASNLDRNTIEDRENWDHYISFMVKNFGLGPHIETYMNKEVLKENYYVFYAYIDNAFPVEDVFKNIYATHNYSNYANIAIYSLSIASLVAGILSLAYLSEVLSKNRDVKYKLRVLVIAVLLAVVSYTKIHSIQREWMGNYKFLYTYVIYPMLSLYLAFVLLAIWKLFYTPVVIGKLKNQFLRVLEKVKVIFANLSLVKRASMIVFGIVLLEMFLIKTCWNHMVLFAAFWILEKVIILPLVFMVLLDLRKIKIAGEEYASGNLEYQLDTDNMNWDFKKHAENMNKIADGLNIAIEKRLQSERMKTELITNVSHDIKTPITSIINYAGLIEKEPCESEKHKEYAEVLVRKATHLKRLLDDLVEASKASTGAIEMHMEECDATILLAQVAGEFEDKIQEAKLELVTKIPETPIKIQADSRRIWRVFENLMINASKYSLEGSRIYISLDKVGENAVFSFRNTSKTMLNISAEELMERFVRGDSARSTEGNGLGLSIAKSLTELQNGNMDIVIDGDLFKVILKFPIVS